MEILANAKQLAREYRSVTGKPLGTTGEVAEYEAARHLGLRLTPARNMGYDATEKIGGSIRRLQIKGRCLLPGSKRSQRLGRIDLSKEWDAVLMVLLDSSYETLEIHEAERESIRDALMKPGSKARNERGALDVSLFKRIGTKRWPR